MIALWRLFQNCIKNYSLPKQRKSVIKINSSNDVKQAVARWDTVIHKCTSPRVNAERLCQRLEEMKEPLLLLFEANELIIQL